mmetsp:Transcript_17532/g.52627  ORF Transcript_17532/g.52627 Transcript_17532/m.52627 type:complete len:157 (-) Transcript_17532:1377-1847(-)
MDMLKKMAGGSDGDNQGQQMQQGQAGGGGVNFSDGIQASDIKGMMGGQGGQGGGINLSDGLDMSDLKGLAGAFSKARDDPNADADDPSHVAAAMGGEQQATGAMGKLTSMFSQQTGKQFSGSDEDNEFLSGLTEKVTGTKIPPSMLFKMAKMGGYI